MSSPIKPIDISVLGRTLRAWDTGGSLTRWLLHYWCFPEVVAAAHSFAITIEAESGRPDVSVGARASQLAQLDGLLIRWRQLGTRWWSSSEDDGGVELQIHAGGAGIRVRDADPGSPGRNVRSALRIALCEALRASGLAPLHAAVIVREGRASALLGKSGTGKSTTLLLAMRAGWLPLAEDFAWLDLESGTVYGWDRGVRLSAAAIRRVDSSLETRAWRQQADGKFLIDYDQLGVQRVWSAPLERMVLLERDAARNSTCEPLLSHEAIRALWESAGLPLCSHNRAAFAAHSAKLLETLEWNRLVIGHTPIALHRQWVPCPARTAISGSG